MNQSTHNSPSTGKNYLFAIAIDEYQHFTTSNHRIKGLKSIIQTLTHRFHFSSDHIFTLFNQDATTQNIYQRFEELVGLLNPEDNLIIYFSGQGEYKEVFNQGYWVPVEAQISTQYISNSEIFSILNSIPAQHILLLTDSCFSSSFFDEDEIPTGNVSSDLGSRWIISAQRVNLVSEDYPDQDIFNKTILNYLSTLKGSLNVLELQENIIENIPVAENVDPMGGALTIAAHEGGIWRMKQKPSEEEKWKIAIQNNTIASYNSFLVNFPEGKYKEEATQKIAAIKTAEAKLKAEKAEAEAKAKVAEAKLKAEKAEAEAKAKVAEAELNVEDDAWKVANATNSIAAFMEYKKKFPNGKYSAEADQKIVMISINGTPEQKANPLAETASSTKPETEKSSGKPAPRNLGTRKIGSTKKNVLAEIDTKKYGKWAAMILLPLLLIFGGYLAYNNIGKKDKSKTYYATEPSEPENNEPSKEETEVNEPNDAQNEEPSPNEFEVDEQNKPQEDETLLIEIDEPEIIENNESSEIEPTETPDEIEARRLSERGDRRFKSGQWANAKSDYTRANRLVPSEYLDQQIRLSEDNLLKVQTPPSNTSPTSFDFPGPVTYLIATGLQRIKGGTFEMGSVDSEANDDEKYIRSVTIKGFMMGKDEVSQKLYKAVMGTNPSQNKGCDDCPVDNVSWEDAQKFIKKLNNMTKESPNLKGKRFRLPTEAEWEYAAKGGKSYKYSGSNNLNAKGWYNGNTNKTQPPFKRKSSNSFGLYNMSGNVAEWCSDWYDENYYSSGNDNNPRNNTPGISVTRVVRGGSYLDQPKNCRVSNRYSMAPRYGKSDIGFRLVLD